MLLNILEQSGIIQTSNERRGVIKHTQLHPAQPKSNKKFNNIIIYQMGRCDFTKQDMFLDHSSPKI